MMEQLHEFPVSCNGIYADKFLVSFCSVIGVLLLMCFSDLCAAFGFAMLPLVDKESITQLLNKGRRSKTSKVKTLGTWATREIRKLKSTSSW